MAGFRSLAWKIGGRALQRLPASEVEDELLLRRLPRLGLFGRPAHPPIARSRLFSSDSSEISCKGHQRMLIGPSGLRQQVEKKEVLLHAAHKTPQPGPGVLKFTPAMKFLTFVVSLIPVMTVLNVFRINNRAFSIEEED